MIKLFTQNLCVNGWTDDFKFDSCEDSMEENEYMSPSEESIAFLKNFARSFVVDLNKDPNYSIPLA